MSNYLNVVKSSINDATMIIVDPSDVTKPCSPHMEFIGTVKDGSTGEFANGYWTVGAVILSPKTSQPIPIYENIYPCKKQGGDGLNAEVLKCLESLRSNGFSPNIPRVYDRGGDSGLIFEDLNNNSEKFIIRQSHNRTVICNGKRRKISEIARGIVCDYEMKFTGKNGKTETCQIGITTVTIQHFTNTNLKNFKVNLVVCKGWGDEPLILYTNLDESIEKIALRVVKAYLKRWRIEELYGFKKQTLNFEGFRVRSFEAIKTLDLIVTVLIGYMALQAEKDDNVTDSLIVASRRIEPIGKFIRETKFFLYAISDGITAVLAQLKCGISHFFERKPFDLQLSLPCG